MCGGFAYRTPPSLIPVFPLPARAYFMRPHSSVILQCRNLNLLSIGYVFPPLLRPRLTQGRSALPWKPWIFGLKDSHLHLATHSGILSTINSTAPFGTASSLILCSSTNPDVIIYYKPSLLFAHPNLFAKHALRALRFAHTFWVAASQHRPAESATPANLLASLRVSSLRLLSQIVTPGFLSFGVVF